ncbi:MAG TPA: S-methyl-5-thioribose-1-phosphate isomerase [Dehalococcoidia bacterium]|nr:S-methyl-5-thioribose-1-phosphate isomerase [Dehalococcoidia bacterium]
MKGFKIIEWLGDRIRTVDQTRLPHEEVFIELADHHEVAEAIKTLRIRGAPDIGVAAAYGFVLGSQNITVDSRDKFLSELHLVRETLSLSRPTAVNLFWALDRMNRIAQSGKDVAQIKAELLAEAQRIESENDEANRLLSEFGAELIQDGFTILTHCNAGSLATAAYGTALGIIKMAVEQGKKVKVYADETRPLLQGARLTTWELLKEGIPVTLITDNMAGYFIHKGEIDCIIVGADRIAVNGDVANKIGTYTLAVLATENAIPFYVAAPVSTIDPSISSGDDIPIEERSPDEVTHIQGVRTAPEGVPAANPAFDVTPHYYVSAIITEKGVIREPYVERLGTILASNRPSGKSRSSKRAARFFR